MGQKIPTRDNCNPDDPYEAFQWLFVALPFVGDQTFTPQDDILRQWSKRMADLGFEQPDPAKAKIKLRPARRGPEHTLNGLSDWVSVDEPDPEPVIIPDVGLYTRSEQEIIAEQLRYHGVVKDEPRQESTARAYSLDQFDPSDATPSEVNGYLKGIASQGNWEEMQRVIAAEMTGKKRDQILRKWPGV